MIETSCH